MIASHRGGLRRLSRSADRLRQSALVRGSLRRLRGLRDEESGVILVLVAGMMVAVLGMGAIAIDISSFYKAQRQAQAAADAGALAASQDLPNSTTATTDGASYATTNYPGATAIVQTPYNGAPDQVKVTVNTTSPAILGSLFGLTSAKISASAVAGGTGSRAPVAIYANDNNGQDANCSGGITLTGNNQTVGGLETNGGVSITGNNDSLTTVLDGVAGINNCTMNQVGNNFSIASPAVQNQTAVAFPVDYTNQLPACTFPPQPNWSWTSNNAQIPDGVYCAYGTGNPSDPSTWNGSVTITGNNFQPARVTFIAGNFSFVGNHGGPLSPYDPAHPLMIYQVGTGQLTIDGNEFFDTGGIIEAKNATCTVNGNSNNGQGTAAFSGLVECNSVVVNGNNFTFAGVGPVIGGGGGGGLVQ